MRVLSFRWSRWIGLGCMIALIVGTIEFSVHTKSHLVLSNLTRVSGQIEDGTKFSSMPWSVRKDIVVFGPSPYTDRFFIRINLGQFIRVYRENRGIHFGIWAKKASCVNQFRILFPRIAELKSFWEYTSFKSFPTGVIYQMAGGSLPAVPPCHQDAPLVNGVRRQCVNRDSFCLHSFYVNEGALNGMQPFFGGLPEPVSGLFQRPSETGYRNGGYSSNENAVCIQHASFAFDKYAYVSRDTNKRFYIRFFGFLVLGIFAYTCLIRRR